MRSFIYLTALLFTFNFCNAQKEISGAWGLKFGDSLEEVSQKTKNKGYVSRQITPQVHAISEVSFAGQKATFILSFTKSKKLYSIIVKLKDELDSRIFESYDRIIEDLTQKYGTPASIVEECIGCTDDKSVREDLSMILFMYDHNIRTVWRSPSKVDGDRDDLLYVQINKNKTSFIMPYITINYYNSELGSIAEKENKAERLEDY